MANIYYHNISSDEMNQLTKMIPGRSILNREHYEKSTCNDLLNADLFRLYSLREEKRTAKEYLGKIKDATLRYFLG